MAIFTDFSQNYTKYSSTVAFSQKQWMSHGTGLCSKLAYQYEFAHKENCLGVSPGEEWSSLELTHSDTLQLYVVYVNFNLVIQNHV